MKFDSKVLTNETTIQNIVDAINQYMGDVMSEFDDPNVIKITSIKVDVNNKIVYVLYNDYTEEQTKLQNILTEAMNIKSELETELSSDSPDPVKVAMLQNKLGELANEFEQLKPVLNITYEFYDVI